MRTFQTAVHGQGADDARQRDSRALQSLSKDRGTLARLADDPERPARFARYGRDRSTASLSDVGLGEPWARSRIADVPHGIEQLTQLAAACAPQPSILILDEPLAGLSAGEVEEVSAILRRLRSKGVTIIVVEHQTRFVFDVCEDVTVLAAGELVKTASASEVRADDRVREVYLGQ